MKEDKVRKFLNKVIDKVFGKRHKYGCCDKFWKNCEQCNVLKAVCMYDLQRNK